VGVVSDREVRETARRLSKLFPDAPEPFVEDHLRISSLKETGEPHTKYASVSHHGPAGDVKGLERVL
jgi:hypothetical protein